MRTTFALIKTSRIPNALNVRSTDSRLIEYVNEAQLRLLQRGKWWGTFGRYNIAVDSQWLTLPAEIDTIERVNICGVPMPLHDQWFEFLDNGWGSRDDTLDNGSGVSEVLYRGTLPTFKTLSTATEVTLKCDVTDDETKEVRLLGYDANNNWVRTDDSGDWTDGEVVELDTGAGIQSNTVWSRITDIQPPSDLVGKWWMYAGTIAGTLIGTYEYWEFGQSAPNYKRYLIPFINATTTTVEIMGKVKFRPIVADTDYLIIGNIAAIKLACMACKAEDEHDWGTANLLWNGGVLRNGTKIMGAIQELENELEHHAGSGTRIGVNNVGASAGFGDPVDTLI